MPRPRSGGPVHSEGGVGVAVGRAEGYAYFVSRWVVRLEAFLQQQKCAHINTTTSINKKNYPNSR